MVHFVTKSIHSVICVRIYICILFSIYTDNDNNNTAFDFLTIFVSLCFGVIIIIIIIIVVVVDIYIYIDTPHLLQKKTIHVMYYIFSIYNVACSPALLLSLKVQKL